MLTGRGVMSMVAVWRFELLGMGVFSSIWLLVEIVREDPFSR